MVEVVRIHTMVYSVNDLDEYTLSMTQYLMNDRVLG